MAIDLLTLKRAKQYTDDSIEGTSGVIAGKNAQIASIEDIPGGKRVTFTWYKDGETVARTETMDVMDGEKGEKGDQGDPGEAGYSPEITVEEATADTYKLKIKTEDGEIVTPNLKGGGEGVDVGVTDQSLVFTY